MIGVAAHPADLDVIQEFFELFKTPWEPAVAGRRYRVLLSTVGDIAGLDAELVLLYSSAEQETDRENGVVVEHRAGPAQIEWEGTRFPIYTRLASFSGRPAGGVLRCGGAAVDYRHGSGERVTWRIGYDLFQEVRHLFSAGQPESHASTPTLDIHIELLRTVLRAAGVSFVEIPARPQGRDFICCLTHDIDFHGIRRHRFDWTLAGFLGRASLGTVIGLLRGRRRLTEALRNWTAVMALPLVHLGLVRDFWQPFESYARADAERRSTFFLVPRRGEPGRAPDGRIRPLRAVPYEMSEIRDEMRELVNRGSEVAVHGINAWRDADCGRAEMQELTSITGQTRAGVRMHWLYFAADSPEHLEAAGFSYDSTWGYNEAIGYRAGTSQVFRLPACQHLLELPLTIMDSAMFYAGNMALSPAEAQRRCQEIVAHARRFGGTVVINWHDRSLAPERLWGRSYKDLLDAIEAGNRAWFATAGDAVDWFRWRRSIRFDVTAGSRCVTVTTTQTHSALPAGTIRVHRPVAAAPAASAEELAFDGQTAVRIRL